MPTTLEFLRETTSDGTLPKYAWPGGYPLAYLTEAGLTVCPKCANEVDTSDPVSDSFVNWEDPDLFCDDCGLRIESAYAEEELRLQPSTADLDGLTHGEVYERLTGGGQRGAQIHPPK